MKSIFSIDDFSDLWENPPSLTPDSNQAEEGSENQPEWDFEMFIESISSTVTSEPVVGTNDNENAIVGVSSAQSLPSVSGQNDFEDVSRDRDGATPIDEYRLLKEKLEADCAKVVALRGGSVKPEDSTSPLAQGEFGGSSSLPAEVKITGVPMKQVNSGGSSREDSDDDDLDEENETTGSLNPEDSKKSRRMLSNRESARRSRRRKQEQTSDLETQVNGLKGEHSSLLKQLSSINQKYDEAAVGNRILKADIETLRAKVKMAEETVKRVTGLNPLLLGRANGHNNNSMPLTGHSRMMDSSCIPAFQAHSNLNHLPNPNIGIPGFLPPNFVPPPSLNNPQLQRVRNGQNHHVAPPSTNPYGWHTEPQNDSAWPRKRVD